MISIEGLIGVGKSTLLDALPFVVEKESVEHWTLLQQLYSDATPNIKTLFEIQVLCSLAARKSTAQIIERSLESTMNVFVPLLIQDPKHLQLIHTVKELIPYKKPDLFIYLDCEPKEALKRIRNRGRLAEDSITIEYLNILKCKYNEWLQTVDHIRIDVTHMSIEDVFDAILAIIKSNNKWV